MTTPPTQTKNSRLYYLGTDETVTGVVETFNNDSQLWEKQNYKDGKREGLEEWFNGDGQLQFRLNYKDGKSCLLYTSPSPRDKRQSRMPSSA